MGSLFNTGNSEHFFWRDHDVVKQMIDWRKGETLHGNPETFKRQGD